MPPIARGRSWRETLLYAVLGANAFLLLAGLALVPSTGRSLGGVVSIVAAVTTQVVVGVAARFGPFSLRRWRALGVSFALGSALAALYLAIVLAEFLGWRDSIPIIALFLGAALIAGFVTGYRTRGWRDGVMAAIWALVIGTAVWTVGDLLINYLFWGGRQQYLFMLYDGAVDDFRRSGSADFNAFLLQDIQGAAIFHQILSVVIGTMFGALSAGAALGLRQLQRRTVSAGVPQPEP